MSTAPFHQSIGQFAEQTDVGAVQCVGACAFDAQQQSYTIAGAGANIWGSHDAFHFVWKQMRGDFIVTARAAFLGAGVNAHRKLGWMARQSLSDGSPHVSAAVHGDGLLSLQYRRSEGGPTEEQSSDQNGADIVQLERRGSTYILSTARDGDELSAVSVGDIELPQDLYVGLFVCSHEDEIVERAAFDNVRTVVPAGPSFQRGSDPFTSHLEIVDVESGQRRIVYSADYILEAPNWTRDGRALIYNSGGRLYRFDLATQQPTPLDTGSVVGNNNDHVLSFGGNEMALSSSSSEVRASRIYTVTLTGGQPTLVTPQGPSYLHGWSTDDRALVYTGQRNGQFDIYRIPVDGGAEEQLTNTPGLDDGPEYSPDGQYIYFNSVRSGRMQIWRMLPDGSHPEQLTDDEYNNWFPHIAPDGQTVVFITYLVGEVEPSDHPAAKRVYLRKMHRDGGPPSVLAYLYGGQGTINVPSWSPDGTQLAFVSNTVPHK